MGPSTPSMWTPTSRRERPSMGAGVENISHWRARSSLMSET